jgi:hypothetical protein
MREKENNIDDTDMRFVSSDLIAAIRSFPTDRKVEHCNSIFSVSPFDLYGICPACKSKIKLRSFSGVYELEDVFDAVFEWLINPDALKYFAKRQKEIIEDIDE